MHITIVGAGIAGLSAYVFLRKHLEGSNTGIHNIRIYETHQIQQSEDKNPTDNGSSEDVSKEDRPTYKIIGAAIGIAKNGLAVLDRMDGGKVLERVKQRGNCISTWEIGTARGWKIVDANVASSAGNSRGSESQPMVMIARQLAWEILRDKVLSIDPEAIVRGRVVEVCPTQEGKIVVEIDDGSEILTDLVVGADGLKSIVRKTMFENNKYTEPQNWWERLLGRTPRVKDYIAPHFEGLTGVGGTLPANVLKDVDVKHDAMAITFGPNGFFGHGYVSATEDLETDEISPSDWVLPLAAWWSTFSSPVPYPFTKQDHLCGNKQDMRPIVDEEAALHNLLARHRSWRDPAIQAILDQVSKQNDTIHVYPTFTTPELPTWHKDNLVLIGDAAHALQPSSGQGACQALEDAEVLALLLSRYLSTPDLQQDQAIAKALDAFDELRIPRLAKIYKQSSKFGKMKMDMNILEEFLMYLFIWLAHKFGVPQKYHDELLEYDLPAQVDKIVRTRSLVICNV